MCAHVCASVCVLALLRVLDCTFNLAYRVCLLRYVPWLLSLARLCAQQDEDAKGSQPGVAEQSQSLLDQSHALLERTGEADPGRASAGAASNDGPVAATAAQLDRGLVAWAATAQEGLRVLRTRHDAAAELAPGHNQNMSLLAGTTDTGEPTVKFVSWVFAETLKGREVQLDYLRRAIYSVPARVPCLDYSMWHIVHPAIGVCMLKEKGGSRPEVPADILRLKDMWQSAQTAHSNGNIAALWPSCGVVCQLCGVDDNKDVAECALCQHAWHRTCGCAAAAHLARPGYAPRPVLTWDQLPGVFQAPRPALLSRACNML